MHARASTSSRGIADARPDTQDPCAQKCRHAHVVVAAAAAAHGAPTHLSIMHPVPLPPQPSLFEGGTAGWPMG